jgi:hypothetical protein
MSVQTSCHFCQWREAKAKDGYWLMSNQAYDLKATAFYCNNLSMLSVSNTHNELQATRVFVIPLSVRSRRPGIFHILAGAEPWFFRLTDIEMTA